MIVIAGIPGWLFVHRVRGAFEEPVIAVDVIAFDLMGGGGCAPQELRWERFGRSRSREWRRVRHSCGQSANKACPEGKLRAVLDPFPAIHSHVCFSSIHFEVVRSGTDMENKSAVLRLRLDWLAAFRHLLPADRGQEHLSRSVWRDRDSQRKRAR